MRKLLVLFLLGALTSCQLFMSKQDKTEKIVMDSLETVDWNEVDGYPYFEGYDCDENAPKQVQRDCFQTVLLSYFSEALADLEFQVTSDLNDTIYVDLEIDEHGFIQIMDVEENSNILNEIEGFNSLIKERLNNLITVKPAHKQGIDVGMRVKLPLVLNTH